MSNKPKVLIVDDAPINIEILKRALRHGRHILSTTDGRDVLAIAQEHQPDLILLDIMMPDMSGYQVCIQLKANPSVRNIPIIFVTALSSGKDELKGLKLGAIDYITKPFDSTLLNVRVQNHLDLKHRQDKLHQLLTERAQLITELKKSRDEAQMANRAKNAFLATMSHEVRTPMNAIIGMTDLTLGTELTTEQRQYLDISLQSSQSLLTLLNNILEFAKIESGQLKLALVEFDPRDVFNNLCNNMSKEAQQKQLQFVHKMDTDIPSRLRGDPIRLRQVLLNLVSNAIKFTKKGAVTVYLTQEHSDVNPNNQQVCRLHGTVTDTGQGVTEEQKAVIFDRFVQGDEYMTRAVGGAGLGLAISRKIVELMGGNLWVISSGKDKGSVFHFTALFSEVESTQPDAQETTKSHAAIGTEDDWYHYANIPKASSNMPVSLETLPILSENAALTLTRFEFLERAVQVVEELTAALAIGEIDNILPHLRWVKDNAAAMGAERLKQVALHMLITIQKGKMTDAAQQKEPLLKAFQEVVKTISALEKRD